MSPSSWLNLNVVRGNKSMPALQPGQAVANLHPTLEGSVEATQITCLADEGAYEVTTVTLPALGSDLDQADYFYFENQAGDDFAVWFDVDANGTPPSGAVYTAATTKIEVNVTSANTNIEMAAAAVSAIGSAFTDVTVVDNLDGSITFTQDLLGTTVDAEPLAADDLSAGNVEVSIDTQGAASTLQNLYFQIDASGGADYFAWLNVGAEGVEPAGTGTAIEATVAAGSTAAQVAAALASAIHAQAAFSADSSGAVVNVRTASVGGATNAVDGDSGFSFVVGVQGFAAQDGSPGGNLGAAPNSPSLVNAPS